MGNLLYLVHRLPYPPNKGDKVRSFNLLKHLAAKHKVFLGTFVDDPADHIHVPTVRAYCADLHVVALNPHVARLRSLVGLVTGEALTLRYYRSAALLAWVKDILAKNKIDAIVVFSSAMGQFVEVDSIPALLIDFVDVDSAKWTQYASNHRWPLSWLYRREGRQLLAYERYLASRSQHSFFVTDNEAALFRSFAPESAHLVESMSNGVDAEFFSPDVDRRSPFLPQTSEDSTLPALQTIVFTGAMDYWPNIDAVTWFVADVLPKLKRVWPGIRFYVVGRSPPASVLALACTDVVVTGTVDDVRPYLQHATVVVAPLRVARGIQNKILEAMAMARPVVASRSCVDAIDSLGDDELVAATSADDFVNEVDALLRSEARCARLGQAGRRRVLQNFSWSAHLSRIDLYLYLGRREPVAGGTSP